MSIVEFIGFLITLFALLFLSVKKNKENSELGDEGHSQQEKLKNFLKSLDIEMEEDNFQPHPKKVLKNEPKSMQMRKTKSPKAQLDKPVSKKVVEHTKLSSQLESRSFESHLKERYDNLSHSIVSESYRDVKDDAYSIKKKSNTSRGQALLEQLPTKKNMVVLVEIFNKPKGLDR